MDEVLVDEHSGFEDIESKVISLFLASRHDLDDLNYLIIENAQKGFSKTEWRADFFEEDKPGYGIPHEVLDVLAPRDRISLYAGIGMMNESDVKLGGLPYTKLMQELIGRSYRKREPDQAANAMRQMKHQNVGIDPFPGQGIEERLEQVTEGDRIQTLRSIFIPEGVRRMFPGRGTYKIMRSPFQKGQKIPSYEDREEGMRHFIGDLKSKYEKEKSMGSKSEFRGHIAPSKSREGVFYFVQRNKIWLPETEETERYDCTCPHSWWKLVGVSQRSQAREPCKHIEAYRGQAVGK